MKKFNRVLLGVVACVAATNACAAGWTTSGKINKISIEYRNGENDIYLMLEAPVTTTTCTRKDYIALVADSEEKLNRMYSTVLAARASGTNISFYTSDDCDAAGMSKVYLLNY